MSSPTQPLHLTSFCDRRASKVGLGACREAGDESPSAIALAIEQGCTVLDTAPHYHAGRHERAIGEAVRGADRDALIISTKVGRVPELVTTTKDTLGFARLRTYIEDTFLARKLFAWDDLAHAHHTFAPAYLRHSVEQSLERMGLAQLDCVFLDGPEVQLRVAGASFDRRMFAAIEALEGLCAAGLVRCYGIATATDLDLGKLVGLAQTAAGDAHRLRALSVPFSLLRQDRRDLVARAADLGLYIYATGCLDGGSPAYQIPDELSARLGDLADPAIAIRWTQSAPFVGTAVFGARDPRHVRANLAAARLPLLDAGFYAEGAAA
ncbi:MAG: aldo/keto reductase [Kofleriaceae bacterium]